MIKKGKGNHKEFKNSHNLSHEKKQNLINFIFIVILVLLFLIFLFFIFKNIFLQNLVIRLVGNSKLSTNNGGLNSLFFSPVKSVLQMFGISSNNLYNLGDIYASGYGTIVVNTCNSILNPGYNYQFNLPGGPCLTKFLSSDGSYISMDQIPSGTYFFSQNGGGVFDIGTDYARVDTISHPELQSLAADVIVYNHGKINPNGANIQDSLGNLCLYPVCTQPVYNNIQDSFSFHAAHFTTYIVAAGGVCGIVLNQAGSTYITNGSIVNYTFSGSCINISANNIIFDCNGSTIYLNTAGSYAITMNSSNVTIQNCSIIGSTSNGIIFNGPNAKYSRINNVNISNTFNGIYMYNSMLNNLTNIFVKNSSNTGIFLDSGSSSNNLSYINLTNSSYGLVIQTSDSNNIFNLRAEYNTHDGIDLNPSSNHNIFKNVQLVNNLGSGVTFLSSSTYNNFSDSNISSNLGIDVNLASSNDFGNNFINCTYNKEFVNSGDKLYRKWYYRAYANDSSGNPIFNVNVSANNVTGGIEFFSLFTNPSLELLNNQQSSKSISMSGNVLLMHMNNQSGYENSTNVYDWSGNGNNGTVMNGSNVCGQKTDCAKWGASYGKLGAGGWGFDGVNDYINISNSWVPLNTNNPFTVSAWVYLNSFLNPYPTITNLKSDNGAMTFYIGNDASYGGVGFGSDNPSWGRYGTAPTAINAVGNWVNIIYTYNGNGATSVNNFNVYINGVNTPITNIGGTFAARDYINEIGYAGYSSGYLFGSIDEFDIWNRSLSNLEAQQLYEYQLGGFTNITTITEYTNSSGITSYFNNFTINASYNGLNSSKSYNVSHELNNLYSVFTLSSPSCINGNQISCCAVINSPGSYELANNLDTQQTCLQIYSDDVFIDGNGYNITYLDSLATDAGFAPILDPLGFSILVSPNYCGILVNNSQNNITIKNLSVLSPSGSISASSPIIIRNNLMNSNISFINLVPGFLNCLAIYGSSINNYFSNDNFLCSFDPSVEFGGGQNNSFSNNNFSNGLGIGSSSNNRILFNNFGSYVELENSSRDNISFNKISAAGTYGLYFPDNSSFDLVSNNNISGSTYGFYVGNTILNSNISSNIVNVSDPINDIAFFILNQYNSVFSNNNFNSQFLSSFISSNNSIINNTDSTRCYDNGVSVYPSLYINSSNKDKISFNNLNCTLYFGYSNNDNISFNKINANNLTNVIGNSIQIVNSGINNSFNKNILNSSGATIAFYNYSLNNTIRSNIISSVSRRGIHFVNDSNHDIISNNTINIYSGLNDIYFGTRAYNSIVLDQVIRSYFIGLPSNITFINSTYGKITLFGINGSGINLIGNKTADIVLLNNSIYVNSSAAGTGLNKSANVSFYGILKNFNNPLISRDSQFICNSTTFPNCYNFSSLNSGNVSFNVSSWSNYSIVEGGVTCISGNNINCCGTVSSPGVYTLTTNIMTSVLLSCINITSSDVILNGNGFYINNSLTSGISIYLTGNLKNITLYNTNIYDSSVNSVGIKGDNLSSSNIYNNSIVSGNMILMTISKNSNFYNNDNNNVGCGSSCIYIQDSTYDSYYNNNIVNGAPPFSLIKSNNSDYYNNNLTGNGVNQIVIISSYNDYFSNNTITTNSFDILTAGSIINATFLDQVIKKYSIPGLSNVTFINSTYGAISFINVNGTGNNLIGDPGSDILFGNNLVYVNSSVSNGGLNKSANVTLYGIGDKGFTKPSILRDGNLVCNQSTNPICINYTSLIASNVIFNVGSWSNYSIGEGYSCTPGINCCGTISSPGVYTLMTNLDSSGTCLDIVSDNVVLDGNSKILNFNRISGTGQYGIAISGVRSNITIKNFGLINDSSGTGSDISGIFADNDLTNSTIYNNQFLFNSSGYISYGSNGITLIGQSINNNITNNSIIFSGSQFPITFSINFKNNSINDIIFNNLFNSSLSGSGIYFYSSNNDSIMNNLFNSFNDGIINSALSSTNNNDYVNNIFNLSQGSGIYFGSNSSNNSFINNTINSYTDGIAFTSKANYNTLSINNIKSSNYNDITFYSNSSNNIINSSNLSPGTLNCLDVVFYCTGIGLKSSINDSITNNLINSSRIGTTDVFIRSANNFNIINQVIAEYNITLKSNITFINTTYGSIIFSNINGSGVNLIGNLSSDIKISNDLVYVNSTKSGLNKTANIFLLNTGIFSNQVILRDGVWCQLNGGICSNLVNIGGGNYSFSVVGFSNYSIVSDNSAPNISQVMTINQSNFVQGTIARGENLTINITVKDKVTNVSNVWVVIWQGIVGSNIIWQGFLNFVSGNLWSITIPTNWTYPLGIVNFTVYSNDSFNNITNYSSNFTTVPNFIITNCSVINYPGNYLLNKDISSLGTCLNITASNVTIDGNGHNITYGTGGVAGYGVYSSGYNNLTIKNANIIDGNSNGLSKTAISLTNSSNSAIQNNNIITNSTSSTGIFFTNCNNNNITSNNITTSSGFGVYLSSQGNSNSSSFNNIISNIISTSGNNKYGIVFSSLSSASINSNNITLNKISTLGDNAFGIFLNPDTGGTETSNIINLNNISTNGTNSIGIFIEPFLGNVNLSIITSNILNISNADRIEVSSVSNNNFTNNSIINRNYSYYDINFISAGINGTWLIDQYLENYTFTGAGSKINVKNSQYGIIQFNNPLNGSGKNFSNDIKIGNNFATVNITNNLGLNKSADIILYATGIVSSNPKVLRDSVDCPNGICSNLQNIGGTDYSFSVTSWSSYSIADAGSICSVGDVNCDSSIDSTDINDNSKYNRR